MINLDQGILVLVCDGDELKAVKNGFSAHEIVNNIHPIPIGIKPVKKLLNNTKYSQKNVLIIGLGGSLSTQHQVGDVVIYESCSYLKEGKIEVKQCDRSLNNLLKSKLNAPLVKGLTINKIVTSPQEKQLLSEQSHCQVVDMESYAVMDFFPSVSVVRVISDSFADFLPDLNSAITAEGKLDNFKMAIAFMKEPLKAVKLIQNALMSLQRLEQVSSRIIS